MPRLAYGASIGIAFCLVACNQTNYHDISASPESHLYYPGSRVIARTGQGESSGIDTGRTAAYVVVDLSSDASMETIYAWYQAQLVQSGWQLRKIETGNGNYYVFSKGDRQLYYVASLGTIGASTKYSIKYGVLPAPCATSPPPLALANC